MRPQNNNKVFFEPVSHTYLMGDKMLMGVTELMEKHHLGADYSGIKQEVLDKAAKEGTALHQMIEDYDNGLSILETPLIAQYRKICAENGLIFVVNELLVSDEELVASKIDGVYRLKNGHYALVDYKFTQKIHRRALSWQLGLYRVFFERQFPGEKVDAVYVLHGDKKKQSINGLFPIEPVTTEEVDALLDAERNGQIYIDQHEEPSLDLVLGENALAYTQNLGKLAVLKAQVKEIEDGLKSYDAEIIAFMEERGLTSIDTPEGKIIKRSASTSEAVDTDKLKSKYTNIWELVKKKKYTKASLTFKAK